MLFTVHFYSNLLPSFKFYLQVIFFRLQAPDCILRDTILRRLIDGTEGADSQQQAKHLICPELQEHKMLFHTTLSVLKLLPNFTTVLSMQIAYTMLSHPTCSPAASRTSSIVTVPSEGTVHTPCQIVVAGVSTDAMLSTATQQIY